MADNTISDDAKALLKKQTDKGVAAFAGTYVDAAVVKAANEALGATEEKKTLEAVSDLAITPTAKTDLVAADKAKNQAIVKVTGADSAKKYTVRLVKAEMKDGAYVAAMKDKKVVEVKNTDKVTFAVANGAALADGTVKTELNPVNGDISLTIKAADDAKAIAVLPQVILDGKVVATGGAFVVTPKEAKNSTILGGGNIAVVTGEVLEVDLPNKTIRVNDPIQNEVMVYLGTAGSKFFTSETDADSQITFDDLAKLLSPGDKIGTAAYYDKASGIATTFTFANLVPGNVVKADVTVAKATDKSITLSAKYPASFTDKIKKGIKLEVAYANTGNATQAHDGIGNFDGSKFLTLNTLEVKKLTPAVDADAKSKGSHEVEIPGLEGSKAYAVAARWVLGEDVSTEWTLVGTAANDVPTVTTAAPAEVKIVKISRSASTRSKLDNTDNTTGTAAGQTDAILIELDKEITGDANANFNALIAGIKVTGPKEGDIPITAGGVVLAKENPAAGDVAPYITVGSNASNTSKLLWVTLNSAISDAVPNIEYKVTVDAGTFVLVKDAPNKNPELTGTFSYR